MLAVCFAKNFSSKIISLSSKSRVKAEQFSFFFIEANITEESIPDDNVKVTGTSDI